MNNVDQVTVAMATQPCRVNSYVNAVYELLPQCDRLCICFNGFDSIPDNCPRSNKIIAICANGKNGIVDLGCNNKMYWVGDFDGYYATVDDDLDYPPNYIETLKSKLKLYNDSCIVSLFGHVYNNVSGGRIKFKDRTVYHFNVKRSTDTLCHRLGMGVAMCRPKNIGLNKEIFLSRPKNFGDDEIVAVWAQTTGVKLICCATDGVNVVENTRVSEATGMFKNNKSFNDRAKWLESFDKWNSIQNKFNDCFFRIIIPVYNVGKMLTRCIKSVIEQSYTDFKIIIVNDNSDDDTAVIATAFAKKYADRISFIDMQTRTFAGGCRNTAMSKYENSKYTLFLDGDDFYTSTDALAKLHDCIIGNNYPDCVNCWYTVQNNNSIVAECVHSVDDLNRRKCIAPWRKCIKTELIQEFVPMRRKYNDVIQHLRQCDKIKTVVTLEFPIITYCSDNKYSAWHGYSDNDTIAALYYVIADLYSEQFILKSSNELKNELIRKYVNMIKNNSI